MNNKVFIGVGSNVGNREENCARAIAEILRDSRVELCGVSSLYLTSPVDFLEQGDFLNGAACIEWKGQPAELLQLLLEVEERMGRQRDVPKGPRTVDLDILLYGDDILNTAELVVPHPELHRRRFAIVPCVEIDPDLKHPLLGRPLSSFLGEIEETQRISLRLEKDKILGDIEAFRRKAGGPDAASGR